MFDDLRDDVATNYEEVGKPKSSASAEPAYVARPRSKRMLGMTSFQRFVIAFMLMLAVCVIGAMALLVTGKIVF